MDVPLLQGFGNELAKIAFTEADAMRVSSLAKKIQLPKAASRPMGAAMGMPGPMPLGALNPMQRAVSSGIDNVTKIVRPQSPEEMAALRRGVQKHVDGQMGTLASLANRAGGSIVQAPRSFSGIRDITKMVSGNSMPALKDPASNRMAHGIVKGHELDELRTRPGMTAIPFGHMSPDVIFREHNRVTTMGPEFQNVKKNMQAMRQGREDTAMLGPFGMKYGDSPRLSRHARRHMQDILERRAFESVPFESRNMMRSQLGMAELPKPAPAPVTQVPTKATSGAQGVWSRIRSKLGKG